ncbi:type II secretion system protein [Sutcliffiella deserti]|uniref:type II secretion system protein n=1 Tax=Sutcliffiella deserti TaxID=2875501 RepID=UPI001CBABFCE|nr:type II secretion system protein [Sutcliffiella deserti]
MLKRIKNLVKNEKGLTLIELLAVVVILGIIAAIAVPSIGGLIDNSKKDAHVANAQQMVSSAKLAVTTNANLQKDGVFFLPLGYLEKEKFIDTMKDPDGDTDSYIRGEETIINTTLPDTNTSFVKVENGVVKSVKLVNDSDNRGVQETNGNSVDVNLLERGKVNNTTP